MVQGKSRSLRRREFLASVAALPVLGARSTEQANQDLSENNTVLEEIASITRGTMAHAGNVRNLPDEIAALPEPEPMVRRLRLWCHPLWAGFLVLLLGVFWTGRKIIGSI